MTHSEGAVRIVLKMLSTSFTLRSHFFPAPEYTACQWRPTSRKTIPILPGRHQTCWRMPSPLVIELQGRFPRKLVKSFPNDSPGGVGSVCMTREHIQSFKAEGSEEAWISLNWRSFSPVLPSILSARSQSAARLCHGVPPSSHPCPTRPASSRTAWRGKGTDARPGRLFAR